jgi:histidine ammonia-lyase
MFDSDRAAHSDRTSWMTEQESVSRSRAHRSALEIDGLSLTIEDVVRQARAHEQPGNEAQVALSPAALPGMRASRAVVERAVANRETVYGITTGFGSLADRVIPPDLTRQLQHNLLRSHAAGAGRPFPTEVVRAAMLLRANSLARGNSGVRPTIVETLLELLNRRIHPLVPEQGSLGASGDLIPLAHLALVLEGLGEAEHEGVVGPAAEILSRVGVTPVELGAKEALALINGTQVIAALASLAIHDAARLVDSAISVATLSAFALAAHRDAFAPQIQAVRPHPGQVSVGERVWSLLQAAGEQAPGAGRVQDRYSLRCIPQVYGAIRDALAPLRGTLAIEINSATDNPLVFAETGQIISGGNFHGHPLALGCDSVKTALASLGTFAERRINLLVDGGEHGLPRFLTPDAGVNSGYMIAHYLAASLVADNRVLAHPASVDSIPTSANVEDYNSMGATAARHLRQVVANVETIVAVEAICAAQACDLTGRLPAGQLGALHARIRAAVPPLERDDRVVAGDVDAARRLLRDGQLIA